MQDRTILIDRIKKLLAISREGPDEAEAKAALKEACLLMWKNHISYDEVKGKGIREKVKEDYRSDAEQNSHKTGTRFQGKDQAASGASEKKESGCSAYQATEARSESPSGEKSLKHYVYNLFLGLGVFTLLVLFLLAGADEIFPGTIKLPVGLGYFFFGSSVIESICAYLLLFLPGED